MKNGAILKRIKKLATFLGQETRKSFEVSVPERHGARVHIDFKTGTCTLETWMESHHNGDSYDEQDKPLEPLEAEEYLKTIESRLFRNAEAKVLADEQLERVRKEAERVRKATERAVFGKP